jgi:hypothetical protein
MPFNPPLIIPTRNPNVISRKLSNRNGTIMPKNTVEKTCFGLSGGTRAVKMMDGKTNVHDLIVNYYMQTGSFAHNVVVRLVEQLYQHHMLSDKPIGLE